MSAVVTPTTAQVPDRTSPMPLWAQVSADLRRRCGSGAFEDGVPGELALSEEYGVSRHTIREALRALRSEGVISSSRGRMSTVQSDFSQSLGSVYSLFRSVESQGATQTSEVVRLESTTDAQIAARLGLPPEAALTVVERVRLADGEPLAHDVSWLPHTLAHPLLDADFSHVALYDLLQGIGVVVDSGTESITATVADDALAAMLRVAPGTPLLSIERLTTALGQPVEWRRTEVLGGRFSFETTWSTGSSRLTLTET